MKHNKKRNTAFLYESLVKELTKAALRSDMVAKKAISSILKEHFHVNSVLHRELGLYKTLCEVRNVEKNTAEKILNEVKRVYHSLYYNTETNSTVYGRDNLSQAKPFLSTHDGQQ